MDFIAIINASSIKELERSTFQKSQKIFLRFLMSIVGTIRNLINKSNEF